MLEFKKYGVVPFDASIVSEALHDYKSPRNKIMSLVEQGELLRLKRGLFVNSADATHQSLSKELIANHLFGPSYVSLESALSFYGLIPERVFVTRSMTTKRSQRFETPLGMFDYTSCNPDYFAVAVRSELKNNEYAFLIASPEKALCDLIVSSAHLRLQSAKAMKVYLEENLRFEVDALKTFSVERIEECVRFSKKKMELKHLICLIKNDCI